MEFQESMMRYMIHKKPVSDKRVFQIDESNQSKEMIPDVKHKQRWRISFYRSSSLSSAPVPAKTSSQIKRPPKEFVCPISGALMADPVIVTSGHTFERNCVNACIESGYIPKLDDGTEPDFSTVIPNLALRATITIFCKSNRVDLPQALDSDSATMLLMAKSKEMEVHHDEKRLINAISEIPEVKSVSLSATSEVSRRKPTRLYTSSDESVGSSNHPSRPLPLAVQPSCYTAIEATSTLEHEDDDDHSHRDDDDKHIVLKSNSSKSGGLESTTETQLTNRQSSVNNNDGNQIGTKSNTLRVDQIEETLIGSRTSSTSSSSKSMETEIMMTTSSSQQHDDEEQIVTKLKSSKVHEIEQTLISLRNQTRTIEQSRVSLCSPKLLSSLRSLITSRYTVIQVNSVAALVNLSLEKLNKVKIVRSGIVPPLIDVLKGGSPEAQEHAAGVFFSLAQDDDNKTVIGVLGALQPLLHALRSSCDRTRSDSALALYHLTLVQSNRSKLVKLGAVQSLLSMVKSGYLTSRIMLILCNLAACVNGRTAMLDAGAVESLMSMLRGEDSSPSIQESCVVALHGLSQGGLRFRGLALAAGAMDVLRKVEITGQERPREKARRIMEAMKVTVEVDEPDIDWEALIDSGLSIRNRIGCTSSEVGVFHSSGF